MTGLTSNNAGASHRARSVSGEALFRFRTARMTAGLDSDQAIFTSKSMVGVTKAITQLVPSVRPQLGF